MPPNTTNSRGAAPGPSAEDEVAAVGSGGHIVNDALSPQLLHSPHHHPQITMGGVESVAEFYRGRKLLITGATGFMGKVLVEKLLRSCPAVDKIFLLMRQRGNKDVQTRLQDLLKSQVFDSVRVNSPDALQKVVAVEGDILEPGLGLSEADTDMLVQSVSVVFHAAATVKFDEVIKLSLKMNVLGVKRIIELCKKMNHLVSLVHVSTAYCNCDRNEVEERVYDPPTDPEPLLSLIDLMDDDLFNHLTPKLVGKRPNTYTFTKALAEHVLVTEARDLPVTIVRPSIVSAAWREPIPGWVDNLNGPTGLIVGAGKGMLRTLHCHKDLVADLIPVDIPINLLIVAACHTATHRPKGEIKVYNCVSGMERPVRWRDIRDHGMHALKSSAAMTDAVWYPSLSLSSYKHINSLGVMFQHWAPAYVLDALARIAGKRPIMVRVAQKLDRAASCLEYFTTHEWRFLSSNVQELWSSLPPPDKKTFNFSLAELNWPKYMHTYCLGAKRYVMKEEDTTISKSQRQINKLWWVQRFSQVVMLLLAWRLLLLRSPAARRAFYALLRAFLRLITLLPLVGRL